MLLVGDEECWQTITNQKKLLGSVRKSTKEKPYKIPLDNFFNK